MFRSRQVFLREDRSDVLQSRFHLVLQDGHAECQAHQRLRESHTDQQEEHEFGDIERSGVDEVERVGAGTGR